MAVKDWSTTAGDNDDADADINWLEGQAPSTVNNSARAMMAAIAAWYLLIDSGTVSGGTVGGTADAISLTNSPTVGALAHGQRYLFRAGSANTGAVTLQVDSTAATALRYRDTALVANDIAAGDIVLCMYDSNTGRFQMLNPPRLGAVTVAATQAQMEAAAATNVAVVPSVVQHHPGVAKCWGMFDFAGAISASHNITSIADTATGRVTVTIATDFSGTSWCAQATPLVTGSQGVAASFTAKAAGTIEIRTYNTNTQALQDATTVDFVGFGDQA